MNLRDLVYKDLITRYKKDKIREFVKKNEDSENKEIIEEKTEIIFKESILDHEKFKEICGFVIVEYSDSYDLSTIYKLLRDAKRFGKKSFHIYEIEMVNVDYIKSFSMGVSLIKGKKIDIKVNDSTGLFKIYFSDGTFMYFSKWISGAGKSKSTEAMYATEKSTWINFLKLIKSEKKKRTSPKKGVFRAFIESDFMGSQNICYSPLKDLQKTPIVHPSSEELLKDMDFYFKNVDLFTRFGMPGVRKVLLVGPPGTGKTSLSMKIARNFSSEKCVVFSTNISEVALHLSNCSKNNLSTIVILEDAEATLSNANSSLLNFLDGVDLPKNNSGSYVIMTTNHPDRIEKRILKRPGRIDKIIEFGTLSGDYALQCAKIYFDGLLFDDSEKMWEEILSIVDGLTGAEIKELAQSTASFAASNNADINVATIKGVVKLMKQNIDNVSKYAEEYAAMGKRTQKVGFGIQTKKEEYSLETLFPPKKLAQDS